MADYSIVGDTKLDTSGFTNGINSMTVAAGNLIADLVKTAGSKLAGLAQSSVSVGMNFDASMSQVAATMGTTVDQIDNLTQVAKEMGSTTKFTATQAADALNYLALAGYDANKAAEVLPSVLNLAAAGGMDLAYASDLVTDAMASLNIEASKQNVDDFGNKLAMAASKANANVSQLGEAILTVGGTAANLKGGTTELTTALGLLANVGIKGAEGGTHLRNIILSLQSPTDEAAGKMEKLGLRVYDAQGNMRGLNEILSDLNAAMNGMTQGQKDSIINQLFNKTDLAAVNGLLAAQGEQWDTLATQIDRADGAMGQMAETQIDNLQGAMTILSSAFEGLQLAVYDELEPALTDVVKWGTDCIGQLSTALTEGGPEAMAQAAGSILSDLASGIADRLPELSVTGVEIIAKLAEDIVAATPAMLDTAANVLGALVQGIIDSLPTLLTSATEVITEFTHYLSDHAEDLIDAGIQIVESLIIGIVDNLPAIITAAAELLAKFLAAALERAPEALKIGLALCTAIVDGIVRSLENLGEAALACIAKLLGVWDGNMDEWGHIGENIVNGLLNGIKGAWSSLTEWVSNGVNSLVSGVKGLLGIHSPSKVFDEIGLNICKGLAQGLTTNKALAKDAAAQVVASVTDTATTLTGGITRTVETTTEILKNGAAQQKQTITETSQQLVNGVMKDVKTITEVAADGTRTVKQTMEDVKATVTDTVKDTQTSIVDGAQVTVEKTTETLSDGSERVSTVTTRTGTEIIEGVERTVKLVTTKTADGVETTVKTIEDAGPQYASAGELLTTQLRNKLEDGWAGIQKQIQTDAAGAIKSLANALKNGDLEQLGLWAASYFWQACTKEQQTQILSVAQGALNQLSSALSGVFGNLASLANSLVAQFVPAAATATGAQETLNIAMDANPILLVISLIGMLVGALLNFASTNKNVANGMSDAWSGVADFMSYIFEGLMVLLGGLIEHFVLMINGLIGAYNAVAWLWDGQIDYVSNPAWDYAKQIRQDREDRQKARAAKQEQAELDARYAKQSGEAEKKQMDAEYAKKAAELAKAQLSEDDPGMFDAEKKLAAADYQKSLVDLEKKLLEAEYKKQSAEISKKNASDATALADAEKELAEAENTLRLGDIEKQMLRLDYEKTLQELEAKYKGDNSSSGGSSSGSTSGSASVSSAKVVESMTDVTKQTDANGVTTTTRTVTEKLMDEAGKITTRVTKTVTETGKTLVDGVQRSYTTVTTYLDGIQQKVETTLEDIEKSTETPAPTPDKDNTDAIEDNTAALLATNEKLAEMVRQADSLVLSDNMAVRNSVAASGTAKVAAAASSYTRQGDTNITQNIYSKAQTAADLQREARWEADRARAQKH